MNRVSPGEMLVVLDGFMPMVWSNPNTLIDAETTQLHAGTTCLVVASMEVEQIATTQVQLCYVLSDDGKFGWCFIDERWAQFGNVEVK